jgi:hypothetical protein
MPTAGLEPAIPEGNRPQTCALDRAATGTSSFKLHIIMRIQNANLG